jgi:hypothetical protein
MAIDRYLVLSPHIGCDSRSLANEFKTTIHVGCDLQHEVVVQFNSNLAEILSMPSFRQG